jgi:hypothetical protein
MDKFKGTHHEPHYTVNYQTATSEQQGLFDAIQAQLGVVPNFLKVFAHSPVALRAFLGFMVLLVLAA